MQEVTTEVEPQVTGSNAFPAKHYNVAVDHNPSNRRSIELRHHKHMQHPRLVEEIFTLRHLTLGLLSRGTSSSRISNLQVWDGWIPLLGIGRGTDFTVATRFLGHRCGYHLNKLIIIYGNEGGVEVEMEKSAPCVHP